MNIQPSALWFFVASIAFQPLAVSQNERAQAPEPCRISVTVRDVADNAPVERAMVSFWRPGGTHPVQSQSLSATDPQKTISIPAGRWIVIAHAPGYRGASGTHVSMPHASPARASINIDSKHPESVMLTGQPGEISHINFAMQRVGKGTVRFSVTAPRKSVSPYVVVWKTGTKKPSALLDVSSGPLDSTLKEGQWFAAAAAESHSSEQVTAVSSGGIAPVSFTVADGSNASLDFTRTLASGDRNGSAKLTIGCWRDQSHRIVEPDAVVVAWQDYRPDSMIVFSANEAAEFQTSLTVGTWHIAATVPNRPGNVLSRVTSTHDDPTGHSIADHTDGANRITLNVTLAAHYRADFAFPANEGREGPPPSVRTTAPLLISGATIHGHVLSETADRKPQGPMKDARIELVRADGLVLGTQSTSEGGYYAFDGIQPGELKATISGTGIRSATRDVRLGKDVGTHVLDFVVVSDTANAPSSTGTAKISVFERSSDSKFRRTDASVVLWKGSDRKALATPNPLSGLYETDLPAGTWSVLATAPGLSGCREHQIDIRPGESTSEEIALTPGSTDGTGHSAIVSVRRQWPGQAAAAPMVTFGNASPVEAVPMAARELDSTASSDLSASHWDWFRATPSQSAADGVVDVSALLTGYVDQTLQTNWEEGSSDTVFLSLSPEPTDEQPHVLLTGEVYLKAGAQPQELLPGTTITLTPRMAGDPISADAANGQYEIAVPAGQWTARVVDGEQQVVATTELFLGATPEQHRNFIVQCDEARQPHRNATDVFVLLEVADFTGIEEPNVRMWSESERPIDLPGGKVGSVEYQEPIELNVQLQSWRSLDGTARFIARPLKPVPAGAYVGATASIEDAPAGQSPQQPQGSWVQIPNRAESTVTAGQPTQLKLTLRRSGSEPLPGLLAGCISYGQAQENGGGERSPVYYSITDELPLAPVAAGAEPETEAVRNATIVARSVQSGALVSALAADGCFELALPAGRWMVSVLIPGREAWPLPDSVLIREGETTRQDVVVPWDDAGQDCSDGIRIYAAVRSDTAGYSPPLPELMLQRISSVGGESNILLPSNGLADGQATGIRVPCTVEPLAQAEAHDLGLDQIHEGTWRWFVGRPAETVEPGLYVANGRVEGCELVFPTDPASKARQIGPQSETVFDLVFAPWSPTVNIVVNGTDGAPRSGIDVRLINTDIGQSFTDAVLTTTDRIGKATITLDAGPGQYNVVLSGQGIEPQVSREEIRQRLSGLDYRIFATGETKTYPLAGVVSGQMTTYEEHTRTLPDGQVVRYAAPVPVQADVAAGAMQLFGIDHQTIPSQLQRPVAVGDGGRFRWDSVPEGRYELVASAPDFLESRQEVQITADMAPVEIVLTRRNVEFETSIQTLLTNGWGNTAAHRQHARTAWEAAKAADPTDPTADFALALVMLNRGDRRECRDLLQSLKLQPPQASDSPLKQLATLRCHELLIYTQLLLRQCDALTTDAPNVVQRFYSSGQETGIGANTAYMMGVASGYCQGPGSASSSGWDAGLDQTLESLLSAQYQSTYQRGREAVLGRYRSLKQQADAETSREQSEFTTQRDEALRNVTSQLEFIQGDIDDLKQRFDTQQRAAEARLAEITAELRQRVPTRDRYFQEAQRIQTDLNNWRTELDQIVELQQRPPVQLVPPGGGGGMGGAGGFGGGGFLFEGAHHQPMRSDENLDRIVSQIDYIATSVQQEVPPAERERQLRKLIFQGEQQYRSVAAKYNAENDRINALQADARRVEDAWNKTYQELDGPYRQLDSRRQQLENEQSRLQRSRPGNTRNIRHRAAEIRNPESYVTYPIEERKAELLRML